MPHVFIVIKVTSTIVAIMLLLNMGFAVITYDGQDCEIKNLDNYPIYFEVNLFQNEITPVEDEEMQVEYRAISVPSHIDNSFKTYMDYRAITDTESKQWQLQQCAYTDASGLRKVEDYYCIALGSAFSSEIGAKFEIILQDGKTFKAILADQKSDRHTDASNKYRLLDNGKINVVEFLVDSDKLEPLARVMGDISYISEGVFEGEIVEIKEIIE